MSTAVPRIKKFPAAKQRRLDQLLEKNAEGTISPKEKIALELLVTEAEALIVANSQRLAEFAQINRRNRPLTRCRLPSG